MVSDVEDSGIFFKTDSKTLKYGGNNFLKTVKYNLELHPEIRSTLSPEELHPEVSEVDQVTGSYYFLNKFITLYKEKPQITYNLSVCLLHFVVTNMSGNENLRLPLKAYKVFFGLSCTSKKAYDLVSGNMLGPSL